MIKPTYKVLEQAVAALSRALTTSDKEKDAAEAELLRVRGLLQYYVDVTVRRGTYNAKLEKEAQLETEGVESADIGKLDRVDKKGE